MRRIALFWFILLSVVIHLLLLGAGSLPSLMPEPERELQPIHMRLAAMQLDSRPAPAPQQAARAKAAKLSTRESAPHRLQAASAPLAHALHAPGTRRIASAVASESTPLHAESSAPLAASSPAATARILSSASQSASSAPAALSMSPVATRLKNFPHKVSLQYQVFYGVLLVGTASIEWQTQGQRYQLDSQIRPIFGPTLRYRSEGHINNQGLVPEQYNAWRNDTPREQARFDWQDQRLEYGDGTPQQTALHSGAQDIFSLIYQLALKGSDDKPWQITTGKKVYHYPLTAVGQTRFTQQGHAFDTQVFRASSSDEKTEFWLAPAYANQPVRIIRTDPSMTLDMRITDLVIDDHAAWHMPKPTLRKHE